MAKFKSCKASLSDGERISFVDPILSARQEVKVRLPFLDTPCISLLLCNNLSNFIIYFIIKQSFNLIVSSACSVHTESLSLFYNYCFFLLF